MVAMKMQTWRGSAGWPWDWAEGNEAEGRLIPVGNEALGGSRRAHRVVDDGRRGIQIHRHFGDGRQKH